MPAICNWPNCGHVFRSPEKVTDICPDCDRDPRATCDENGKDFFYSSEFLKGKKILGVSFLPSLRKAH